MQLRWSDVNDIAIELVDTWPDIDPMQLNFVELREHVLALPGFADAPERCGEKVLEAIQMAWLEERD